MDPAELDRLLSGLPRHADANLIVGFDHRDDAAVYRLPSGELLVQTVDFFTPVVDDPYDYGAIAAANSLSDIYAMNGRPLFALNICGFPRKYSFELWREVLRGGADKAREAGIVVVGGHTVDDPEPKYGLVVTGLVSEGSFWTNEGAQAGDALLLTKPLGTGIITTTLKAGELPYTEAHDAVTAMKTLNRTAASVLAEFTVHACTDITGYGLLGHAAEIVAASGAGMEISLKQIPFFAAAPRLAASGKFPGGTFANRRYFGSLVDADGVPEELLWLLFDAQTSGGLLAALPHDEAQDALSALRHAGVESAAIIGRVVAGARIRVLP